MLQQPGQCAAPPWAPRSAAAWGVLLLIVLLLLPATASLAGPDGALSGTGHAAEASAHAHGPLDRPACRHGHHPVAASALAAEKRDVDLSPSDGDGVSAIPAQGPACPPALASTPSPWPALSVDRSRGLPVYLLTRRLRV